MNNYITPRTAERAWRHIERLGKERQNRFFEVCRQKGIPYLQQILIAANFESIIQNLIENE